MIALDRPMIDQDRPTTGRDRRMTAQDLPTIVDRRSSTKRDC